jgi:anthranilate synthase component 1
VSKLMTVEKYSHVQHLVTELQAELRPELDRFDALGACFPAGTVTGAPKIRAMQGIAELERGAREAYSGAVSTPITPTISTPASPSAPWNWRAIN